MPAVRALSRTALHRLQEMQPPGLKPNVITYNAAISAWERGHKPTGAATVTGDVVPGPLAQCKVITYNGAICACDKGHNPHRRCIGYMRCSSQASGLA